MCHNFVELRLGNYVSLMFSAWWSAVWWEGALVVIGIAFAPETWLFSRALLALLCLWVRFLCIQISLNMLRGPQPVCFTIDDNLHFVLRFVHHSSYYYRIFTLVAFIHLSDLIFSRVAWSEWHLVDRCLTNVMARYMRSTYRVIRSMWASRQQWFFCHNFPHTRN